MNEIWYFIQADYHTKYSKLIEQMMKTSDEKFQAVLLLIPNPAINDEFDSV